MSQINISRNNIFLISFVLFLLILMSSCNEDVSLNAPNGLIVIVKADDLGETNPNWNKFMKMVIDNEICASIGIITKNVTTNESIEEIKRISNILQPNQFPIIEFWNHGYDHSRNGKVHEFQGTDILLQDNHIQLAQNFFSQSLNLTSKTFSAPFNKTSIETANALGHFPEIKVWMCYEKIENQYQKEWKDPNKKLITIADQRIMLNVDYLYVKSFPVEKIIDNYKYDKKKPYILIQIHPGGWDDSGFEKFKKLIDFFKTGNRAIFMTPFQYYQYLHKIQLNS
jgi:peptidoglycan/xylan/chitin deacetylase (PgdA/CDA1 family)